MIVVAAIAAYFVFYYFYFSFGKVKVIRAGQISA